MSYEEIEAAIQEAPGTQIPALLTTCVKAGIKKSAWRPYWISSFVDRIERKVRQS